MAGPLADLNSKNISERGYAIWGAIVAGVERGHQVAIVASCCYRGGVVMLASDRDIHALTCSYLCFFLQWLTTEVCPVLVNNLRDWSEKGMALWHTFSGRLQSVMLGNFYIMSRVRSGSLGGLGSPVDCRAHTWLMPTGFMDNCYPSLGVCGGQPQDSVGTNQHILDGTTAQHIFIDDATGETLNSFLADHCAGF